MRRRAGAGGGDEERGPTSDDSAIDETAEVPDGDEELAIVVERAPGPRRRRPPAVYKPARGERPLWDFPPHTLHFRETATYVVDAALGFGLVPPTVLREGPHGPGSVQLLISTAGRSLGGALGADIAPAILAM